MKVALFAERKSEAEFRASGMRAKGHRVVAVGSSEGPLDGFIAEAVQAGAEIVFAPKYLAPLMRRQGLNVCTN